MRWLNKEALSPLSDDFSQVQNLLKNEDPEDNPYKSKYEARKILEKIKLEATEFHEQTEHSSSILGHIICQIGCIDIEVEELSTGETNLLKSLDLINKISNQDLVVSAKVKAQNQLGLLWCLREDYEKAAEFLESSLESYNNFVQESTSNDKSLFELQDLLADEEFLKQNPPFYHLKSKVLDQLTIYTHYYLGQAYEKLGIKDKASESLHKTLKKQIEIKDYEPLDWSRNASMLAIYYMAQDQYERARHLLSAANHIFQEWQTDFDLLIEKTEEMEEKGCKCKADIARTWGKYCHLLLQTSIEKKYSGEEDENEVDSNLNSCAEVVLPLGFKNADVPYVAASDFEQARKIFIPGQKFYNEAKEFYTFENHCIDYTEINQDLSRMYRALILFEPDSDRKFQMYRRSAQLLEPIYKDLNPQPYLLICRQLTFELGEIYSAMADLKLSKFNSTPGQVEGHNALTNNINKLISMAQFSFLSFLGTLKTEEGTFPEKFSEDTCRPALLAMLNLARVADKVVVFPPVSKEKLGQVLEAYNHYKQFSDYCKFHPEDAHFVDQELPLCDEMVKLLPVKIIRMKQELGLE